MTIGIKGETFIFSFLKNKDFESLIFPKEELCKGLLDVVRPNLASFMNKTFDFKSSLAPINFKSCKKYFSIPM